MHCCTLRRITNSFVRLQNSGKALRGPPKYTVSELQEFVDFLKAPK